MTTQTQEVLANAAPGFGSKEIGGTIRTILTFGGGYAVARGWTDEATMTAIVGGLVSAFTLGWSIWNKKVVKAEIRQALDVPPPRTTGL